MTQLFPELSAFRQGWLPGGHGHSMHWELSGNIKGKPVVWLHGGPGSCASPLHRRFFDPEQFLIIQYDQRGCGKSHAIEPLVRNQTNELVQDLEQLREFFGLTAWSIVGGSWGGALALAYAQQYSAQIEHLLLRSPFLCSLAEIDAFMNHPPASCLSLWHALNRQISDTGTESLLEYGYRVFCLEHDIALQSALAVSWAQYESAMNAFPDPAPEWIMQSGESLITRYQIQCHYLHHKCFVTRDALLGPEALKKIKLTLIHGEQDALCPVNNSETIHAIAPDSTLIKLPHSGHALGTQAMQQALLDAVACW
jgi:proline iminopeptidase